MNPVNKRTKHLLKIFLIALAFGLTSGQMPALKAVSWAEKPKTDVDYWLKELKSRKPQSLKVASVKHESQPVAKSGLPKMMTEGGNEELKGPKKISVDFYKVDLHNVFRLLGQVSGKNVVVDEDVKGTLTLALENVPWTFVLEVIKNLKGLNSIEKNNTIMIYPRDKAVAWAAEANAKGTLSLEVRKKPVVVQSKKSAKLLTGIRRKSVTPLKEILKAEKLIKKAAEQEKRGNIVGAFENLKKAAEIWPDNPQLAKKVAALALERQDPLTALNYAKTALRLDKKDGEVAAIAAIALARLERGNEAKAYFEMAISDKADRDTLWNYAVFSFSQGDYRQALRLLNRIEANYSVDPDVIMLKAQCYEYLAKTSQAIEAYRTVVNAGSGVSPAMINFAKLRLKALIESEFGTQQERQ